MRTGVRSGSRVVLVASLALAAIPGPALAAGYTRGAYRVPVTQPDEFGMPVMLDTDVYLPKAPPPRGGYPFVAFFHGGGSDKRNGFDAGNAAYLADRGYVTLLYSARGHGDSGGQTSVAGPKEVRDTFDVLAWALGIGGRSAPPHPSFRIDRGRMGLSGYSQGGLNTNMAQAWSSDARLNPYGVRFRALAPGNTPDVVFNALVPNNVVKLSFGVGLIGTYVQGTRARVAPKVPQWIATAAADQPSLYGGAVCDLNGHDTPTSTIRQDLAARSVGCKVDGTRPPAHWAQAFDDALFPPEMAISMWRRSPAGSRNRLYLSMGGHAAPSADRAVEADKLRDQAAFFDHYLRGRPLNLPPVVYWVRDPAVAVPQGTGRYPARAWIKSSARTWPPAGIRPVRYRLDAGGRAVTGNAREGAQPLAPVAPDAKNDPVAQALLSPATGGSSPDPSSPPEGGSPGQVASFSTAAFARTQELSGSISGGLSWVPAGTDSQLVLKVFDAAPDGRLTLLSRGVQGIRGAPVGQAQTVNIAGNAFSSLIRKGHRVVAWVSSGDPSFYKPYPGMAGGTLQTGNRSTLTLPLGTPTVSASGRCVPRWLRVGRRGIWRLRLGNTRRRVLRAAGAPQIRRRRAYRYCVSGGGRLVAAFSSTGRVRLVVTTGRRHRSRRVHRGARLRAFQRAYPRARRVARGLFVVRRRRAGSLVVGVRRRRVRFVAVVAPRDARRVSRLRVLMRRAGLRRTW